MVMKQQLKKKAGKKGFTLIEVIVVLVILAILAAIAVPALTGYIDRANNRAAISEARNVYVALQAIATDLYGQGKKPADPEWPTGTANDALLGEIAKLTGKTFPAGSITNISFDGTALKTFTVVIDGKTVAYDGSYTVN